MYTQNSKGKKRSKDRNGRKPEYSSRNVKINRKRNKE